MSKERFLCLVWLTMVSISAHAQGQRCATPERRPTPPWPNYAPEDCGYFTNSPEADYEPGDGCIYEIQVVFHVIQDESGNGFVSAGTVNDQVDILNEDYQALTGTPGEPGTNAKIRFRLATSDPDGDPTSGITYSMNDRWFDDRDNYWDALAWDTNRYMNVYTNQASGAYGYVAAFASEGNLVGETRDRVVLNWQAIGRLGTPFWPANRGRTATHEVGHYLGLYHTFDLGCGDPGDCYGTGDLICDTNGASGPTGGCPAVQNSCGNPDPIHNYMDYTDDACMWEFTAEQILRLRCTLEHWRPDVFTVICDESDCSDGLDNDSDGDVDCCDTDCATDPACASESACDDGQDNDCDTFVDCEDSDCLNTVACGEGLCDLDGDGSADGLDDCCDNATDDDGDGDVDCDDSDCAMAAPCLIVVEDCDNGTDDDGDGLIDCDDPDCFDPTTCGPETNCGDGQDNDADGLVDCDDPDCFDPVTCGPETNCGDDQDNDADGLVDCDDPDCFDPMTCGPETNCGDSEDNDADGLVDCDDPDCFDPVTCGPETNCGDAEDNDADGLIDCDDPDCLVDDLLDCDGDGVPNGVDCQAANPMIFDPPEEVASLGVSREATSAVLDWSAVGDATSYGVLSGSLGDLWATGTGTASGECAPGGVVPSSPYADARRPPPVVSGGHWYVVRAQNPCPGTYGLQSDLLERPVPVGTDCP